MAEQPRRVNPRPRYLRGRLPRRPAARRPAPGIPVRTLRTASHPAREPQDRAGAFPPAPTRRWTARRIAYVAVPVVLVVAAAILVPAILKARSAYESARDSYEQIFVTPVPRPVVSVNPQGTPVIVPDATAPPPELPDWDKKERVNILLLGVDTTPARAAEGSPPLSDTMIVVTIDPVTRQVGMLSIPRDLLVTIPGVGDTKINAAYPSGELTDIGGPALVRATIEHNFGIPIHYFAEVDFAGFQTIVDTLGGVTIDVPAPIKDDEYPAENVNYTRVYFHTGLQYMDGQTTLQYARTRHDDNDFARGARQQQVLRALREQALDLSLIRKAPELLEELGDTVRTDIPPGDLLRLAKLGTEIQAEDIHSYDLLAATTVQWNPGQPYYLIPNWPAIQAILDQMMPPVTDEMAEPTSTAPVVEKPDLASRVLIVNGTRVNRLASRGAAALKDAGFLNVNTAQAADAGNHPTSAVISFSDNLATARLVADILGLPESAVLIGNPEDAGGNDLMVVLGDDAPLPGGS